MELRLYKYVGVKEKIIKTITPCVDSLGNQYILQGDIKEDCNIMSPTITINMPLYSSNTIDFNQYNYCYIVELARYYFIINKTINLSNMITLTLSEDVLYTGYQKSQSWLSQNLYCVRRSSGSYMINDEKMSFNFNDTITDLSSYIVNDTSATISTHLFDVAHQFDATNTSIVISVINDVYPSNHTDEEIKGDGNYISNLTESNLPFYTTTSFYKLTYYGLGKLMSLIYNDDVAKSFIKSIVVLPYNVDVVSGSGSSIIRLGNTDYNLMGTNFVETCKFTNIERFKHSHFKLPSITKFYEFKPYSNYFMYIPFMSTIELDYNRIANKTIQLYYYVNYEDGSSEVILYNTDDNRIEYQGTCQLGIRLAISSTNQLEISDAKSRTTMNMVLSTIGGVISIVGGAVALGTGHAMGGVAIAGGVSSIGGGIAKGVMDITQQHLQGSVQITSGVGGMITRLSPYITKYSKTPVLSTPSEWTQYSIDKGLPYYKYIQINDLSVLQDEYILIDDDNIPMDEGMILAEYQELCSLLKQGVRK